jgi:hypothetical protein
VTVSDTESNSEVYSTPPTSPIWSSDDTYPKLDFLEETGTIFLFHTQS